MRALRFLLGAVVVALAWGVALALVAPFSPSGGAAIGIASAVVTLPPLVLTLALRRGLARVDARAGFIANFLGLTAVCASAMLVLALAFARRATGESLSAAGCAHPEWSPLARDALARAGEWLAPRLPPPPPVNVVASGSASAAPSTSAGPVADRDGTPVKSVDAEAASSAPGADAGAPEPVRHLFADLQPCDYAFRLVAGDFDGDHRDEIVVWCLASVHVLSVTPDDKVVETYRFAPTPPTGLVRQAGVPSTVDADGDGALDLLLCTTWTTDRGGTRGGASYLARGDGHGRFEESVTIGQGPCNALGLHDVTGDGVAELVTLHTGNPWDQARPNGSIAWANGKSPRWTERGQIATDVFPRDMAFGDYDGDGIDDVLVWHDWDRSQPRLVYRGSRGKNALVASPADAGAAPPEVDRSRVAVALDADGQADEAVLEPQTHVSLYRTAHPGERVVRDITVAPPR